MGVNRGIMDNEQILVGLLNLRDRIAEMRSSVEKEIRDGKPPNDPRHVKAVKRALALETRLQDIETLLDKAIEANEP
jgi:hypothetical protein